MTQAANNTINDVNALTAGTGAPIPSEPPNTASAFGGCKLASGTKYFFMLGDGDSALKHCTAIWDANLTGTIQIETTSVPKKRGSGPNNDDLTDYDNGHKGWVVENPSSGTISTTSTDTSTGGATVSSSVITLAGGTAGAASLHVGNMGAKRMRIAVNVTTTGGYFRLCGHGKD